MARYSLNYEQLSDGAKEAADGRGARARAAATRSSRSWSARVEILFALEEALRPDLRVRAAGPAGGQVPEPRAADRAPAGARRRAGCSGTATGWRTDGSIAEARIVPPTSQNQARIEQDLLEFVQPRVELPDDRLQWECEQAIRNYDPCISCSTHFLKLDVDRG